MATYCGRCYCFVNKYPFGFCKKCWIKAGKPLPMNQTSLHKPMQKEVEVK